MSFKVVILSPMGLFLEKDNVEELYLPSTKGPLGILSGYTPGYFKLAAAGILKIKAQGETSYFASFGGFAECKNGDQVNVVVNGIESSDSIDMARAMEGTEIAKKRIAEHQDSQSLRLAKLKLERNLIRISAKQLGQGHQP